MKRSRVVLLAVLVAWGLSLAGCADPRDELNKLLPTLPVPPGAVLVSQHEGSDQGSADACFSTYTKRLYGSEQSFDEIAQFYAEQLENAGWTLETGDLAIPGRPTWEKGSSFQFIVRANAHLDFPRDVVAAAEQRYKTVYFVVLRHLDYFARTWCLKTD